MSSELGWTSDGKRMVFTSTTGEKLMTEPVVEVETAGDRMRREWAAHAGNVTRALLNFLRGRRRTEITTDEIEGTQTFARSSAAEQQALQFVTAQSERLAPSESDRVQLAEHDNFLTLYVQGSTLGHRDWCQEIEDIPWAVRRAQKVDESLFPTKQFPSPELFSWLWRKR